jgi:hypothetical protein
MRLRVALALGSTVLLGAASAHAAPELSSFEHAGTAVAGPLEGDEGDFFVAVEAFLFDVDGEPVVSVTADAIFGDVECLTNEGTASATFDDDLSSATLTGSVTGVCFDFSQEEESSYSAEFEIAWTAIGRVERRAFATRGDGRVCSTMVLSREAAATGTLTWSAPELGIGGTGSPFGRAGLERFTDRCVATG